MGLKHEIYNPTESDDPELFENGGKYRIKYALLQVTVRLPERNPLNLIALIYGFLPFILGVSIPAFAINTGRFVYFYAIGISLTGIILSELILKPIFKDPRPRESANRKPDGTPKYGMPSGHSLNVAAIMVWSLLEILHRESIQQEWLYIVLITCGPVAWARVHNKDHTWPQVIIGTGLGICIGTGAFLIRTDQYQNHWFPWERNAWQ